MKMDTLISDETPSVEDLSLRIDALTRQIAEWPDHSGSISKIGKELREIKSIVTAPRAVVIGDGLIMAKLAFDNLMIIVEQSDRLIGPHLIMNGIYEKGLTAYLRQTMAQTSTFVDVGANIGYYSVLFGKHLRDRGHVFAFEPDPSNYDILVQNTQINWIDKKNIVTERLAVADQSGQATLYRNDIKPGNTSLLQPGAHETDFITEYQVEQVALDSYFGDREAKIDLMKVDVEGYEYPVLKGAVDTIKAAKDFRLVLEWDPSRWQRLDILPRQILDLLEPMNLSPYVVSSRGEIEKISSTDLEALPYANIVFQKE